MTQQTLHPLAPVIAEPKLITTACVLSFDRLVQITALTPLAAVLDASAEPQRFHFEAGRWLLAADAAAGLARDLAAQLAPDDARRLANEILKQAEQRQGGLSLATYTPPLERNQWAS